MSPAAWFNLAGAMLLLWSLTLSRDNAAGKGLAAIGAALAFLIACVLVWSA